MVEQNMLGLFWSMKICPDSCLNSDHPRNCAFFEPAFVSGIFWCGWFLPPQFNTLVWFCTWDRQRELCTKQPWDRSKPVLFSGMTSILVRQHKVCFFPGQTQSHESNFVLRQQSGWGSYFWPVWKSFDWKRAQFGVTNWSRHIWRLNESL